MAANHERVALASFITGSVLAGGNAVGMGAGGALLVIGSVLAGERLALPECAATWLAVGYLALLARWWCSCSTSSCSDTGARRERRTFVLVPVVTVVLS